MLGPPHAGCTARQVYASLVMRAENPTLFPHLKFEVLQEQADARTSSCWLHCTSGIRVVGDASRKSHLVPAAEIRSVTRTGRCSDLLMLAALHVRYTRRW